MAQKNQSMANPMDLLRLTGIQDINPIESLDDSCNKSGKLQRSLWKMTLDYLALGVRRNMVLRSGK